MNLRATGIHVVCCLLIGGLASAFTPAKWLAVALWVSAAMVLNGSIATVEDARAGGFDNPDGSETFSEARGSSASWFALKTFAIVIALASLGLYIQFR